MRQRTEVVELGSEHLVSIPDASETRVNIQRLIADALRSAGLAGPPRAHAEATAIAHRAMERRGWRPYLVAATAFALVWNVMIGAYLVIGAPRSAARPLMTAIPPAATTRAAPGVCTTASKARVLARSVLVRGGVEATAFENRIALGVVKAAHVGLALELDSSSLAVKTATKVLASDPVTRVVPSLYGDGPLDAMAEVGPLHVVPDGDGDVYQLGVQRGFLVWRSREASEGARLWPMSSDVEAPRAVRAAGGRVVVFRRDAAIWVGQVRLDRDGAHPEALVRVSEPAAQVGAPAIDARGDEIVASWAQRDARGARWTVLWARWRGGARVGPINALVAPGAEGAIAPSVAMLVDGRFVLSWTEGGALHHRVRAQQLGRDDRPIGAPLDVSLAGADAGQAQLAIGADGHGTAGYLVAHDRSFDLVATSMECP